MEPSELRESKLKTFLKSWEEGFKTKEGRAPKPQDVKHRPRLLRKYKEYTALKKSRGQHKKKSSANTSLHGIASSSTVAILDPTCIPNSPAKWAGSRGEARPQRRGGARLRIPESPDVQSKGRNLHNLRKPGQMNAFQRSLSMSSRSVQSLGSPEQITNRHRGNFAGMRSPPSTKHTLPATPEHSTVVSPLPSNTLFKLDYKLRKPGGVSTPLRHSYSPSVADSPATPPMVRSSHGLGDAKGVKEQKGTKRNSFKRNFGALLGNNPGLSERTELPPAKRVSSSNMMSNAHDALAENESNESRNTAVQRTQSLGGIANALSTLPTASTASTALNNNARVTRTSSLPGLPGGGDSAAIDIGSPIKFRVKRSNETMAQSQIPKRTNSLQCRSLSGLSGRGGMKKGLVGLHSGAMPRRISSSSTQHTTFPPPIPTKSKRTIQQSSISSVSNGPTGTPPLPKSPSYPSTLLLATPSVAPVLKGWQDRICVAQPSPIRVPLRLPAASDKSNNKSNNSLNTSINTSSNSNTTDKLANAKTFKYGQKHEPVTHGINTQYASAIATSKSNSNAPIQSARNTADATAKASSRPPAPAYKETKTRSFPKVKDGDVSNNFVKINLRAGWKGARRGGRRGGRGASYAGGGFAIRGAAGTSMRSNGIGGSGKSSSDYRNDIVKRVRAVEDRMDDCLDALGDALKKKAGAKSGNNQQHATGNNAQQVRDDRVSAMRGLPAGTQVPKCSGHDLPCVCNNVKKKNANHGRQFFGCSLGSFRNGGCNFFMWVDNVNEKAVEEFMTEQSVSEFDAERLNVLTKVWTRKSVAELKSLLKRFRAPMGGTKAVLVERLRDVFAKGVQEVRKFLDKHKEKNGSAGDDGTESEGDVEGDIDLEDTSEEESGNENESSVINTTGSRPRRQTQKKVADIDVDSDGKNKNNKSFNSDNDANDDSENEVEKKNNNKISLDSDSDISDSSDSENSDDSDNEGWKKKKNKKNNNNNKKEKKKPIDFLHSVLQTAFGFEEFHSGQQWAIERCLAGKSSLIIQPTGAGKSLCFQLPALLLDGVTLVVTPLISLMDDQLARLPPGIPGACLHGRQSKVETARVLRAVRGGHVKVLFISPERLCSESFRSILLAHTLGKVSLVCVDEAHCISSWSHNFRPSYMRIRAVVLDPDLGLQNCPLLALTATATKPVVANICEMLAIPTGESRSDVTCEKPANVTCDTVDDVTCDTADDVKCDDAGVAANNDASGVYNGGCARKSIRVLSRIVPDHTRLSHLIELLRNDERLGGKNSVIIYASTRRDVDVIADRAQSCGIQTLKYHAGLKPEEREKAQRQFMCGKVKIVVATVAFGMGIDKSDVRAVIHYGMPRGVDSFVQELGRAGRDGNEAWGFVLFDTHDALRLHSLSHSDDISEKQVMALLRMIHNQYAQACRAASEAHAKFAEEHGQIYAPVCACAEPTFCERRGQLIMEPVPVAVGVELASAMLGIREHVLETLMVKLSLPPHNVLSRVHSGYAEATVRVIQSNPPDATAGIVLKHAKDLGSEAAVAATMDAVQSARSLNLSSRAFWGALGRLERSGCIKMERTKPCYLANVQWCMSDTCVHEPARSHILAHCLTNEAATATLSSASKVESIYRILMRGGESDEVDDDNEDAINMYGGTTTASKPNQMSTKDNGLQELVNLEEQLAAYYEAEGDALIGTNNLMRDEEEEEVKTNQCLLPWLTDESSLDVARSDLIRLLDDKRIKGAPFAAHVATCVVHGVPHALLESREWRSSPMWAKWRNIPFLQTREIALQVLNRGTAV